MHSSHTPALGQGKGSLTHAVDYKAISLHQVDSCLKKGSFRQISNSFGPKQVADRVSYIKEG